MLVDSGADISIFSKRIGDIMGVDVEQGDEKIFREIRSARLSEEVTSEYGMHRYLPVKLAGDVAYPTFNGSGLITSIAYADGFVVIGEDETLTEGKVDVWVF